MQEYSLGVMVDMSRNAVMKAETVKKFASVIKKMGYNTLYMYMEDTYEVEGEPYFGHIRGRYTVQELRDIDKYCEGEGMAVIPCIQVLAHLNQIFKWNEYKPVNDVADILLVEEDRSYQLIDHMFSALRKAFRTDKVNIGMDEAHLVGLGKYLDKHGYKNRFEIIRNHLLKVKDIAASHGFRLMMWSDMFFRLINHGDYYLETVDEEKLKEVKKYIPDGIQLIYWDYAHNTKEHYLKQIRAHKILTDNMAYAGGCCSWLGFAPFNKGAIDRMEKAMDACRASGIRTLFLTMWGDNGKECSSFSLLPALYFCAQRFLYGAEPEQIKEGFFNLFGIKFDTFALLDIPNAVRGNVWGYPVKWGLYNDPIAGLYDYHIAVGDGEIYKKYANILSRAVSVTGEYSYLFENLKKLCCVMELKYDLGVRTRKAYKEGDRAELDRIANKIYPALIRRLRLFYEGFRDLWEKENKPNGFDVQDIRIGGLERRLRHCRKILNDYLVGKTDSVPELEEDVLPYEKGKEKTANLIGPYDWAVTPNLL